MQGKYKFIFSLFLFLLLLLISPSIAEELPSNINQIKIPLMEGFPYKLQKYSGFNFLIDFVAESALKVFIKIKTKAKKIYVDLEIYDGWDLIRKKAKYFNLKIEKFFVKGVPVEYFELRTNSPIYFRKNKVVLPLGIKTNLEVNLKNVNEVINNLPKWKEVFQDLELPIPPFGSTRIAIKDFNIEVNDNGLVQAQAIVTSLVNPKSDPIKIRFTGGLTLRNKKIVISNLESEIEDIFTKDSETGVSFSKFLEDLINPIFNFHKYEKNGLTIDTVDLSFKTNSLLLEINSRLLP